jgi:hypothetical protein
MSVCVTEEEKVKQDDGLDQLIEKEESGNNVQERKMDLLVQPGRIKSKRSS